MDTHRVFLAIVLSFLILLGYQYFYVSPQVEQGRSAPESVEQGIPQPLPAEQEPAFAVAPPAAQPAVPQPMALPADPAATRLPESVPVKQGRDITIDTELYTVVVAETGGGFKSFQLKEYKATTEPDSGLVELVRTEAFKELPLYFSWGVEPAVAEVPLYTADREKLQPGGGQGDTVTLKARMASGLEITRTLTFDPENYQILLAIDVYNASQTALKGSPYLTLTNRPFSAASSIGRYLFSGPALLVNGGLEEIKPDDLIEKASNISGNISWTAYEGTYFMTGIIPAVKENQNVKLTADGDKVSTVLSGEPEIIPASGSRQYQYTIYFGPKKLSILKEIDDNLEKIVNFGWFDKMAKPALYLLNFFNGYIHNYGVAIILTTILIKMVLWPISHKGMRSMKNMQALQPKITKLRAKYKDDATRMNQEMMNLYKTYKINPLGGCLPMLLQIPVFFALYKVLLQAIELRHAPFMLWITDLSAPDRLWPGLGIPYLEGIPILTLLMGGSMFLQQKMSPAPADPTQAKIMMFLPIIFTFMFLNFASGLVLYWFINNLLSIAQQYTVNRPVKT